MPKKVSGYIIFPEEVNFLESPTAQKLISRGELLKEFLFNSCFFKSDFPLFFCAIFEGLCCAPPPRPGVVGGSGHIALSVSGNQGSGEVPDPAANRGGPSEAGAREPAGPCPGAAGTGGQASLVLGRKKTSLET